jgi:gluconate kinase
MIKTTRSKFAAMAKKIKDLHPKKNPEIIASEVTMANKEYFDWLIALNDRSAGKTTKDGLIVKKEILMKSKMSAQ